MTQNVQLDALFPEGLRGMIFDCDGVLVNSRDANISYYNMILQELGKPPMTPEEEAYTHMATSRQAVESITTPEELLRVPDICSKFPYQNVSLPLLDLEPGILDLLQYLKERGVRLAVHTNRGRGMGDVLDKFNLRHMFDPVMTVEHVQPKPDPQGVLYILRTWGLPAGQVAFVGDSLTDAGAARGAQVPLIAYKNTSLNAALHISDFDTLRDNLQKFIHFA